MKNYQKISIKNVVLVVIIIILLVIVWYFASSKKSQNVIQEISNSNITTGSNYTNTTPIGTNKLVTPTTQNSIPAADPSILKITSVVPTSVSVGTTITINGNGFSIQNPTRRTGMSYIPTNAEVIMQDANRQNIRVYALQQGVVHNDSSIIFTLPAKICKYDERGCSGSDPSSYYFYIVPGVYKLYVQIPNTDYFSNSVDVTVR